MRPARIFFLFNCQTPECVILPGAFCALPGSEIFFYYRVDIFLVHHNFPLLAFFRFLCYYPVFDS